MQPGLCWYLNLLIIRKCCKDTYCVLKMRALCLLEPDIVLVMPSSVPVLQFLQNFLQEQFDRRFLPMTVYINTEAPVILTGNLNQSEAYALVESISQLASPIHLPPVLEYS